MNSFDVVILSVNGRGIPLARQLTQKKRKTAVIEIFNDYHSADRAGPFGFFIHSVRPSHWVESSAGFSVKTLEKSFHFKEFFLSSVYQQRAEYQNLLSINSKDFKHLWLRVLLKQLTTGVDVSLKDVHAGEDFSFVFKDFGLLQNISQKFNSNISVFSGDDFDFNEKKNCFFHPFKGEVKGENIVCLLNPEEMKHFKENWRQIFFKSSAKPYWCWQRLPFKFEGGGYPVPLYLVLADPNHIPWNHERLICLKRSLIRKNHIDLWIKRPCFSCHFSESLQRITKALESYFPKFQWTCQSRGWVTPVDLFPVYSRKDLSQMCFRPGVHYGWPVKDISPNGWFRKEQNILKSLL